LTQLLRQREELFAYTVTSRALEQSAIRIHAVDTQFFVLMAAQSAIFAIIAHKVKDYPPVGWALLLALILAIIGTALTVFVREVPSPRSFVANFADASETTRGQYLESHITNARLNDRLRTAKTIILLLALATTIVPLIIATAWRAGVV
jgi:hypothetical protein